MKDLILIPLEGVLPILFGMKREESRLLMSDTHTSFKKIPESNSEIDTYFNSCFQVSFDDSDVIEYIEISKDDNLNVKIFNLVVFNTEAEELIAEISKISEFDKNDPELGYSYIFPKFELSFWRPYVPELNEDSDSKYFSTVGIGRKGYYST